MLLPKINEAKKQKQFYKILIDMTDTILEMNDIKVIFNMINNKVSGKIGG
ncbi:MAG: hypothetical protein K0R78_936 [Pelosinus sp.]|jgi:hypothetical protein|nr:hypothetical protein [Pelosinus sp.]